MAAVKNDTELKKLKIKICELKQTVGKLTMENYILPKTRSVWILGFISRKE